MTPIQKLLEYQDRYNEIDAEIQNFEQAHKSGGMTVGYFINAVIRIFYKLNAKVKELETNTSDNYRLIKELRKEGNE